MDFSILGKIKCDCVVSLGSTCRTAGALRRNRLRYFSNPLDWMMGYNLDHAIIALSTKGKDFFNNVEFTMRLDATGL